MSLRKNVAKRGSVTIASGAATSGAIHIKSGQLAGISTPSNLQSVATLTLTVCDSEDGTYVAFKDNSTSSYTITLAVSSYHAVSPIVAQSIPEWIKFVANGNAGADLVLGVHNAD